MLAGVDVGFGLSGEVRESAAGIGYVLGLEVLTVLVAVLGFGLIRRWGEVVPGWVPRLGGRTIPPLVPIIVGGIGSAVLLGLIGSMLATFVLAWTGTVPGWTPDVGMTAGERAFLLTCYVPFFLWPVAIAVALIGYARRRLGTRPDRTRVRQDGPRSCAEARGSADEELPLGVGERLRLRLEQDLPGRVALAERLEVASARGADDVGGDDADPARGTGDEDRLPGGRGDRTDAGDRGAPGDVEAPGDVAAQSLGDRVEVVLGSVMRRVSVCEWLGVIPSPSS